MNAFNPSSFRQWLAKRKSASRSQVRRRKNAGRTASAQTHVVVQGVELLEDRVVLDAERLVFSSQFNELRPRNGLTLVAIGPNATFKTEMNPSFDSQSNLGKAQNYLKNESGRFVGTVVSTTSPVEVWNFRKTKKLFTLPEGGMFREFAWSSVINSIGSYSPRDRGRYTDIVPRFGVVAADNGLSPASTTAQQQLLETSTFITPQHRTFTISWKGQTTRAIRLGAPPAAVESALNALSNIGKVGGKVSVVQGAAGKGSYVVTFGGSIYKAPALLSLAGSRGVNTKVSVVTSVALTKRDDAADNNGTGLVIPLSGTPNVRPNSFAWSTGILPRMISEQSFGQPDFWTIPADRATTFPVANAPRFTPVQFGVTQTFLQPRILGKFEFDIPGFNGAFFKDQSGNSHIRGSKIFTAVVPTAKGFELNVDFLNYDVLPTGVDSLGKPRPVTVDFGGLTFEVLGDVRALIDIDTGKIEIKRGFREGVGSFNGFRAKFPGGSLHLDLNEEGHPPGILLDTRTGSATLTNYKFRELEIGGYRFLPPEPGSIHDPTVNRNGAVMTYDAATQKFNFRLETSFDVSDGRNWDPLRSKAVVLTSAPRTDFFANAAFKVSAPDPDRRVTLVIDTTPGDLSGIRLDLDEFTDPQSGRVLAFERITAQMLQNALRSQIPAFEESIREEIKQRRPPDSLALTGIIFRRCPLAST
jgi:hypothetical protein